MRKAYSLGFKILISCGLLGILLYNTNLLRILRLFQEYSLYTIVLAMLSHLTAAFIAAIKWHTLLPSYPFKTIAEISFIRNFYSVFFFGQVTGDFMRIYMLRHQDKTALSKITASVLIDRITGFLSLSLVGGYGLLQTQRFVPRILLWLITGIILTSSGILLSLRFSNITRRLLYIEEQGNTPSKFLKKVRQYSATFAASFLSYSRNLTSLLLSTVYGIIFQLFCITATVILARGLNIAIPFVDWCWIFWTTTIILFIPISISGLGLREGSFVGLLSLFGIPTEKAIALSFSVFGLEFFLGILGGILELKRQIRN